jgi:hypothetical protein
MYKVVFENLVYNKIDKFIDWYTNIFLKMFNDTWIYNEYLIVDEYRKRSIKLNEEIYNSIFSKLSSDVILWCKKLNNQDEFKSIIFVWNFMIIISYKNQEFLKTRLVYDITFHKR